MFFKILLITFWFIDMSLATAVGNKLYYFEENTKMTHDKASEECKKMGMNLASITTEQEYEYLKEYILQEYGQLSAYWLGAHKSNGQWLWKGSGEKIEKFFWHQGEPTNTNGIEDCIKTWKDYFDWNDNDCNEKYLFICDIQA